MPSDEKSILTFSKVDISVKPVPPFATDKGISIENTFPVESNKPVPAVYPVTLLIKSLTNPFSMLPLSAALNHIVSVDSIFPAVADNIALLAPV